MSMQGTGLLILLLFLICFILNKTSGLTPFNKEGPEGGGVVSQFSALK